MKKRSVGLVIITQANGILFAVCQKRAQWNTEKDMPESFPGCLQVSCHGKLEESEDFYAALIRESKEELGDKFTRLCQNDVQLHKMVEVDDEKKHVVTYAAFVTEERLAMIEPGKDVGGLVYLSEAEVNQIIPIDPSMKENGSPDGKNAMFQDEIDAIKKAINDTEEIRRLKKIHEKCQ
ncbi:MAG: NUDIX hydrolase [Candidatus Pacebacteria bacterium]|nr:NUDIX hydrolase [Candidatus Paceibacterota bacterium]